MTALLLTAAAFCQWPLPERPVSPPTVYDVELIEINTSGTQQQVVFWGMPVAVGGRVHEVLNGRIKFASNEVIVIQTRDGEWVYEDDRVEIHAKHFIVSEGYDSVEVMQRMFWVRRQVFPELLFRIW